VRFLVDCFLLFVFSRSPPLFGLDPFFSPLAPSVALVDVLCVSWCSSRSVSGDCLYPSVVSIVQVFPFRLFTFFALSGLLFPFPGSVCLTVEVFLYLVSMSAFLPRRLPTISCGGCAFFFWFFVFSLMACRASGRCPPVVDEALFCFLPPVSFRVSLWFVWQWVVGRGFWVVGVDFNGSLVCVSFRGFCSRCPLFCPSHRLTPFVFTSFRHGDTIPLSFSLTDFPLWDFPR